jgi:hypothetical protein
VVFGSLQLGDRSHSPLVSGVVTLSRQRRQPSTLKQPEMATWHFGTSPSVNPAAAAHGLPTVVKNSKKTCTRHKVETDEMHEKRRGKKSAPTRAHVRPDSSPSARSTGYLLHCSDCSSLRSSHICAETLCGLSAVGSSAGMARRARTTLTLYNNVGEVGLAHEGVCTSLMRKSAFVNLDRPVAYGSTAVRHGAQDTSARHAASAGQTAASPTAVAVVMVVLGNVEVTG